MPPVAAGQPTRSVVSRGSWPTARTYDHIHRLLQRYWTPFIPLQVVDLPVCEATHSSQDGYHAAKLLGLLDAPTVVGFDPHETTGVVLAVRDGTRLMIYDGNHRFAAARLRGHKTVPARIYEL